MPRVVTVGSRRAGGYVEIIVAGYEHPRQVDFDDGNWLTSAVRIEVDGFSGKFGASLRAEEFESLLNEINRLDETLAGRATYQTLEGQLGLEFEVDRLGHVSLRGAARNRPGGTNQLTFEIPDFDQSYLKPLADSLRELLDAFPVRGR